LSRAGYQKFRIFLKSLKHPHPQPFSRSVEYNWREKGANPSPFGREVRSYPNAGVRAIIMTLRKA
jgi:hypothetical protein